MSRKAALLYVLLIGFALAVGLFAGARPAKAEDSTAPSVENPGPHGTLALYLFLKEGPSAVRILKHPLSELPPDTQTLVLPMGATRAPTEEELALLEGRVRAGLQLLVLAPETLKGHALFRWLELEDGSWVSGLNSESAQRLDYAHATADVWRPMGLLEHAKHLRVAARPGLSPTGSAAWVAVAGVGEVPVVMARPLGKGQVWVFAGPEVGQNAQLGAEDNLAVWEALAGRGPVVFDEHLPLAEGGQPPLSSSIAFNAAQLLLLGLTWAWMRGTRLGPPRHDLEEQHRSSVEYLRAMAELTQRAHVEGELVSELLARFRRTLLDKLALPLALPAHEVAFEVERRVGIPGKELLAFLTETSELSGRPGVTPGDYARLSRDAALWTLHLGRS